MMLKGEKAWPELEAGDGARGRRRKLLIQLWLSLLLAFCLPAVVGRKSWGRGFREAVQAGGESWLQHSHSGGGV